jgi:hypothetical protein
MMKRRRASLGAVVAGFAMALAVWVGGVPEIPPLSGAFWPMPTMALAQEKTAAVEGFRSARFGMMEADVRKALRKDFDIAEDDIGRSINSVEKTTSLVINVPDKIPDSGTAVVGYIFGFKSKRLIQVNIIWGAQNQATTTAGDLVATANILRRYFIEQGFPAKTLITNAPLKDGSVLVFRGIDDQGRVALLQLNVEAGKVNAETGVAEQSVSLSLNYIVDPKNPDVFNVEAGQF